MTTTLLPFRVPGSARVPAELSGNRIGDVALVRCVGDLDLAALDGFSDAVRDALADRPSGLVLDLSEVEFCDTVGLRILLSSASRARTQGCAIALAGVQPTVTDLLARVCADRTLPAYPDVASAIEGLTFARDWRY